MDKFDLLFRKLCTEYDEQFTLENIVPTEEAFIEMANRVREQSRFKYEDSEFMSIREQVRELRSASIGLGLSIDKPSTEHDLEWYNHYIVDHPDSCKYNKRFELYMQEAKHWSQDMISDLDYNTTQILNRLGDPNKQEGWKRKGLVIGDVQSGKTANYTSVCNKAIDAGYKIIIILAGRTNTLRKQTQKRLESDFVGLQKQEEKAKKGEITPTVTVGVGLYGSVGANCVETFTTGINDFSKKVADTTAITINKNMMPKLFVVKKVKSVLDNLADWLRGPNNRIIDVPMLLIDDEADDASVNTRDDNSPTAINACIRRILRLFSRSTYLAVTATPFANILINPYVEGTEKIDPDLFPDDFIYCLPTPSNYYGSEKLFRDDSCKGMVVPVKPDDVKDAFPFKHKKTQDVPDLPSSLKTALRYYAITNAVRDILGHVKTHRSMMINVSRFVDVQNRLKAKVRSFWFDTIMLFIKSYSKMGEVALKYSEIQEIKKVFDDSEIATEYHLTWEQVQDTLYSSNEKVDVRSVNQKSSDSLDYELYEKEHNDGLRVIAIGGDCLSRGLTLEGLCVSYFYRNSQMYDTLMQMGRWFGYRPGYDKLVKVWMSDAAVAWYSHISEATETLKLEVYRMNRNKQTPLDFGYKICGHPDALIPTARAKMKNAKVNVSYAEIDVAGHLIECPRLHDSEHKLNNNRQLVEAFIERVTASRDIDTSTGDYIIRKVPSEDIASLVQAFKTLDWHFYFDGASLADNIRGTEEDWNVIIKNGSEMPSWTIRFANGMEKEVGAQRRQSTWNNNVIKISGSKVKVGAGGCTSAALEGMTMNDVRSLWEKLPEELCMKRDRSGYKDVSDEFILHYVKTPALFIHYIKLVDEEGREKYPNNECKVIALGLGFPSTESYEEGKKRNKQRKKVKVYLNVIAQELSDEEGDDVVNEDM